MGETPSHQRRHLEVGSIVEVKTDEQDFEDTTFYATVIFSKNPKPRFVYVEYRDLLAREGGTDLLREYVDVSFVRPLPPQEVVNGLSVGDVVEAYYNDGWWKGVVKRVVKGGERFRIKFHIPPDEREFGISDLRIHWNWADGVWSRPNTQAEKASLTEVGGKVEVSRDSTTHYSWFRSSIRKLRKDNGPLLVHFSTLKDTQGVNVMGIVDPSDVRPCAPHFQDKPFLMRQNVDAYFEFGWWSGVVAAVLDGGNKYVVTVAHTNTAKLFRHTELRPHMDWDNGIWTMPSQFSKVKHNPPEVSTGNKTVTTSNKNSPGSGSTLKLKISKKPSKVTPPLSKRKKDSSDSRDAPSQTLKRHKEDKVVGTSEQVEPRDSPVTKMALGSPVPVATPLTAEDNQSPAIHSREKTTDCAPAQASNKKRKKGRQPKEVQTPQKASKNENEDESNDQIEVFAKDGLTSQEHDPHIIAKKGDEASLTHKERMLAEKLLLPYTPTNGSTKEANSPKSNSEELVKETRGLQTGDGPTERGSKPDNGLSSESQVEAVPDPETDGSGTETTSYKCNGEKLVKESIGLQPDDGSTERGHKLDNGQRSESQVEGQNAIVPDPETNGSATETTTPIGNGEKLVKESMVLQPDGSSERGSKLVDQTFECQVEGKKLPVPDPLTNGSATETSSPKNYCEKLVNESMIVQPGELSESRSKPIDDRTSESQGKDASESKTVEVVVIDEDDDIMEEPLWNVEDSGRPLSYSIEGWSSAPKVGESQEAEEKAPLLKMTQTGEQSHSSTEEILADTPDEQQTLPFVKSSFLWQTFESMEVFKQNPQKPHFQPLKQQKMGSREGLAIGYMVIFLNTVEKLSKLEFGDPDGVANDMLDTLAELEEHGFDVGAVRDRVAEIVVLGDKKRKLVVEANELRSKMMVHSNEISRIEEETCKMYEELRRLQEKVSIAQLALDNENDKIASVRADLVKTEQGIENVEREFHDLVSAKW